MGTQRKQTKEWEPWYRFSEDGTKVSCVFCNVMFSYKRERAFAHFGYKAKSERSVCPALPRAVRHKFSTCANYIPQRMREVDMELPESVPTIPSHGVSAPTSSQSTQNEVMGPATIPEATPINGPIHMPHRSNSRAGSNSTGTGSMRQQRLQDALNVAKRKELDEVWASFFYESNVPFNVARQPSFIAAVRATCCTQFDYTPPTYHQLRTNLIEPRRRNIEKKIADKTNFEVKNYGVTLCTDGWDDVNRRPLMNVMMSCPSGDVFLGSIDTTGQKKTMAYISDQMKVFIDKVGPMNVTQICTDNAANMLGAMDDIVLTYPHIFKQGCMAHAIDLLLEDWAKIGEFKDLIERAKKLCHYIRNHHATMSTFRQLSPNKQIIVPAETRFACNFLMMQRLLEVKPVLTDLKNHPRVQNYFAGLRNRQNGEQAATRARNVVTTIEDVGFWQRCQNYVHMTEDVLKALRLFDGKEPAMGRAWLAMHNLRSHVYSLREPPFSLRHDIADVLEASFDKRWDMVFTDMHYAGALLNPYLKDHLHLSGDGTALRALYRVIRKLEDVVGVHYDDVLAELTEYEASIGPYSPDEAPNIRATNMQPHLWWKRIGDKALSKIAVRILSLTCSASSCERNWSMYSFVHNKSRNRLAAEKAESLVYIYTNSRMLRERAGAEPARWYEANIYSEDSDPDALGPIPVGEPNREFSAMHAEEEEELDMEANRAPPVYAADRNLWRAGQDALGDPSMYYGDEDDLPGENIPGRWGPFPRVVPRGDSPDRNAHPSSSSSESEEPTNPNNGDDNALPNNDDEDHGDNPPPRDDNGKGPRQRDGGEHVTRGVQDGIEVQDDEDDDVFAFTDSPTLSVVGRGPNSVARRNPIPTMNRSPSPVFDPLHQEAEPYGNAELGSPSPSHSRSLGRPPQVPRAFSAGQYGSLLLGNRGGRGERSTARASTSRPPRRLLRGIGSRDSNELVQPFVDTYVPGPTRSTPAFVVHRGPTIDSDAEDPIARKHKRLRPNHEGPTTTLELRNVDSEVEDAHMEHVGDEDESQGVGDEADDEENDTDCDEAPNDDDVVIREIIRERRESEEVRRSSRLSQG